MAKRGGNLQNLKAPLSPEEARRLGSIGGKKSVEVRRERKLLSQMYAELLAKGFEIEGERLSIDEVTAAILSRKDNASVSMLKEIREATEGNKLTLDGPVEIVHTFDPRGL